MKSDNTFIKLGNSVYRVQVINSSREILVNNKWMNTDDFVGYLIKEGKYDEISELTQLGANEIQN